MTPTSYLELSYGQVALAATLIAGFVPTRPLAIFFTGSEQLAHTATTSGHPAPAARNGAATGVEGPTHSAAAKRQGAAGRRGAGHVVQRHLHGLLLVGIGDGAGIGHVGGDRDHEAGVAAEGSRGAPLKEQGRQKDHAHDSRKGRRSRD